VNVPLWVEIVVAVPAVIGAVFTLIGSLGLARLSDFGKRLHGPTKATTLGVGCILIASMLWFGITAGVSTHELLITLFLFVTAPVSAQMLIKAAMRRKLVDPPQNDPAEQSPGG
jgi:multicomponent K+:H+ antiporter subunit G